MRGPRRLQRRAVSWKHPEISRWPRECSRQQGCVLSGRAVSATPERLGLPPEGPRGGSEVHQDQKGCRRRPCTTWLSVVKSGFSLSSPTSTPPWHAHAFPWLLFQMMLKPTLLAQSSPEAQTQPTALRTSLQDDSQACPASSVPLPQGPTSSNRGCRAWSCLPQAAGNLSTSLLPSFFSLPTQRGPLSSA